MPRKVHGDQRRYRLDRLEMPDILAMERKLRAKVLRKGARVVAVRAREIVPVRSGYLKKSISYSVLRGATGAKVRSKAPHAHLVHDGTKAHSIFARSKDTARAGWRFYFGSVHRKVKHPGASENPFLVRAAEQTKGDVEVVMREVAEQVLADVAAGR